MDPAKFSASEFGDAAREPGNTWAFWSFLPAPIPRQLGLTPATIKALSEADASLGKLAGMDALVRDPHLLIGPYLTREAVASSRIEGTQASLSDVLRAEAGGGTGNGEDVAEVERNIEATRQGYELVKTLPITRCLRSAAACRDPRPDQGLGVIRQHAGRPACPDQMRPDALPVRDHPPVPRRKWTHRAPADQPDAHGRRSAPAVSRSERLVGLREDYLAEASKTRSNLPALVDMMFTNPFLTVSRVERQTGLTNQGARNLIKEAARRGWVEEIGALGRGGRMYWVARELYQIIDGPVTY